MLWKISILYTIYNTFSKPGLKPHVHGVLEEPMGRVGVPLLQKFLVRGACSDMWAKKKTRGGEESGRERGQVSCKRNTSALLHEVLVARVEVDGCHDRDEEEVQGVTYKGNPIFYWTQTHGDASGPECASVPNR